MLCCWASSLSVSRVVHVMQLELKQYKEARLYLVIGFNEYKDSKFLKVSS